MSAASDAVADPTPAPAASAIDALLDNVEADTGPTDAVANTAAPAADAPKSKGRRRRRRKKKSRRGGKKHRNRGRGRKSPPAVSETVGEAELALMKSVFDSFDKDHDGNVNLRDFIIGIRQHPECAALLHLPVDLGENKTSENTFLERFQKMDVEGSKALTWEEYKKMVIISEADYKSFLETNPAPGVANLNATQQEMASELFVDWADSNGLYISKDNYIAKMKGSALGETQGLAFLEIMNIDASSNKHLNLPEFVHFFDEFHGGAMTEVQFAEFLTGFQPEDDLAL